MNGDLLDLDYILFSHGYCDYVNGFENITRLYNENKIFRKKNARL